MRSKLELQRTAAVAISLALLMSGLLIGSLTAGYGAPARAAAGSAIFQVSAGTPLVDTEALKKGFRPVVQAALPAVVNVSSEKVVRTPEGGPSAPFFFDPFFGDYFRDRFGRRFDMPRERREHGLGSGVIVSQDGYILTNEHVIRDASAIKVVLTDRREFKAKVVGSDPKTDVAVLKVEATGLPFLEFGASSEAEVGDLVLAMGNPFGIGQTVTQGIVSAKARRGLDVENYEDFIQTDAAINPGNSGGPLVNMNGELIGINTAIISRGGGNQGIGFAVPSDLARHVMRQIIDHGKVRRGWLGVVIQPVDQSVAKAFGLPEARGALVGDVEPGSPAARAGIRKGDIVLEVDGQRVADVGDLRIRIAMSDPNTRVRLKVFRDRKQIEVPVTLGDLPAERAQAPSASESVDLLHGVEVQDLTPRIARQLGLEESASGVVVTAVRPGTPAAEAGLRRGDVIQELNRQRVANTRSFEQLMAEAGTGPLLLLVNRGGNTLFVVIEQ